MEKEIIGENVTPESRLNKTRLLPLKWSGSLGIAQRRTGTAGADRKAQESRGGSWPFTGESSTTVGDRDEQFGLMDVIYDEHDAHDGGSCLGDDAYPHGLEGLDTLFCAC